MAARETFKKLSVYLAEHKEDIVSSKTVLVENWSPTYGYGDPSSETIEVVNFDALLKAIDEFAETFKDGNTGKHVS